MSLSFEDEKRIEEIAGRGRPGCGLFIAILALTTVLGVTFAHTTVLEQRINKAKIPLLKKSEVRPTQLFWPVQIPYEDDEK